MAALRETAGPGRGDRSADHLGLGHRRRCIQCGFTPVSWTSIRRTLGMDNDLVLQADHARHQGRLHHAHAGLQCPGPRLLDELQQRNIPLIEDVCESHGAGFQGRKLGTFGLMSNFSFYYAHHMSTVEGGMVSTDDRRLYEMLRMFRSHGMVRECSDAAFKEPTTRAVRTSRPTSSLPFRPTTCVRPRSTR